MVFNFKIIYLFIIKLLVSVLVIPLAISQESGNIELPRNSNRLKVNEIIFSPNETSYSGKSFSKIFTISNVDTANISIVPTYRSIIDKGIDIKVLKIKGNCVQIVVKSLPNWVQKDTIKVMVKTNGKISPSNGIIFLSKIESPNNKNYVSVKSNLPKKDMVIAKIKKDVKLKTGNAEFITCVPIDTCVVNGTLKIYLTNIDHVKKVFFGSKELRIIKFIKDGGLLYGNHPCIIVEAPAFEGTADLFIEYSNLPKVKIFPVKSQYVFLLSSNPKLPKPKARMVQKDKLIASTFYMPFSNEDVGVNVGCEYTVWYVLENLPGDIINGLPDIHEMQGALPYKGPLYLYSNNYLGSQDLFGNNLQTAYGQETIAEVQLQFTSSIFEVYFEINTLFHNETILNSRSTETIIRGDKIVPISRQEYIIDDTYPLQKYLKFYNDYSWGQVDGEFDCIGCDPVKVGLFSKNDDLTFRICTGKMAPEASWVSTPFAIPEGWRIKEIHWDTWTNNVEDPNCDYSSGVSVRQSSPFRSKSILEQNLPRLNITDECNNYKIEFLFHDFPNDANFAGYSKCKLHNEYINTNSSFEFEMDLDQVNCYEYHTESIISLERLKLIANHRQKIKGIVIGLDCSQPCLTNAERRTIQLTKIIVEGPPGKNPLDCFKYLDKFGVEDLRDNGYLTPPMKFVKWH